MSIYDGFPMINEKLAIDNHMTKAYGKSHKSWVVYLADM